MSGKVVNIAERKTDPHVSGPAFCLKCHHTWHAVCPVGVETPFECPACNCMSGRFRFEIEPPSGKLWTCDCSNQLFNVLDTGEVFCPACGTRQRF